ncbi:MAG: hypothetical protein STSR0006_07900 [Lentimicrobium sp.]
MLKAAEQVTIGKKSTLREEIDHCPLAENHPLHKELKEGFPKGYLIALDEQSVDMPSIEFNSFIERDKQINIQPPWDGTNFKKGDILCFSLYLIGNMTSYYQDFIRAIRNMCQNGMGHPPVIFSIIDICEKSHEGKLHLLSTGNDNHAEPLINRISFSDFQSLSDNHQKTCLEVTFQTPVMLFKQARRNNPALSYQDKSNGFPSFYQLVRSVVNRMVKLTLLYVCPEKTDIEELTLEFLNDWIDYATNADLLTACLQKITLKNTPKKESEVKVPLYGYIGKQRYEGYFNRFLPMLKFMQALGVGNETVYGLGRYRIDK